MRVSLFVFALCAGCGGPATMDGGLDGSSDGPGGGAPDLVADAGPSPSIGCDLPENAGVMPHECSLYYQASPADVAIINAKCSSPGKIVASCAAAGVVGVCRLTGAAFGKSNIDVVFQFGLAGGGGAFEDEYRYNTTFGESECMVAGGTWMP